MRVESGRRKTYTREYKVNAVRLTDQSEHSVADVARDLGINENTLYKWRSRLHADPDAFPGKGNLRPADEELRRLRRENHRLEQENAFLKRAAVWLAQEAHGSTS